MKNNPARQNTLLKIRNALKAQTPSPYPDVVPGPYFVASEGDDLVNRFTIEFTSLLGKLVICDNQDEVYTRLNELAQHENWNSIHYSYQPGDLFSHLNQLPFIQDRDIHSALA